MPDQPRIQESRHVILCLPPFNLRASSSSYPHSNGVPNTGLDAHEILTIQKLYCGRLLHLSSRFSQCLYSLPVYCVLLHLLIGVHTLSWSIRQRNHVDIIQTERCPISWTPLFIAGQLIHFKFVSYQLVGSDTENIRQFDKYSDVWHLSAIFQIPNMCCTDFKHITKLLQSKSSLLS